MKLKITAERIRINRQGYDSSGRYWGHVPGEHLYFVESQDGEIQDYIRAKTSKMAKDRGRILWNEKMQRAANAREYELGDAYRRSRGRIT